MNQATTTNILTHFPRIAASLRQRDEIVKEYAKRYVEDGHQHESLRDAANQTALDCIGLDEPFEIKKLFRQHVRQLRGRMN